MNERDPIRRRRGRLYPAALRLRARSVFVLLSLLAATACGMLVGASLAPAATPDDAAAFSVEPLCSAPAPGYSGCLGLELAAHAPLAQPGTRAVSAATSAPEAGAAAAGAEGLPPGEAAEHKTPTAGSLSPADVLGAYGLTGATPPSQQTIALVDAYNDVSAEADLKVFDEQFGLPECMSETAPGGNGCFKQVNQNGETTNLPFPTTAHQLKVAREGDAAERKLAEAAAGWALEIATDVDVAHGVCPSCHILLVEANSNANDDLYAAEQTAATLGATEISNSWGGEEPGVDYQQFNHPGVVITASAGDDGYLDWLTGERSAAAEYPASSPHVIAVGGTRLNRNGVTGAWQSETIWNDGGMSGGTFEGHGAGGGGCSVSFTAPAWQQLVADWSSVGCAGKRAVADVSADADPYTGVAVFDSTEYEHNKGWSMIGGTSVASPIIASTFALAGGANGVDYPAATLYENELSDPAALHDVEVGSNGECLKHSNKTTGEAECTSAEEAQTCSQHAICLARSGYDGPSGVGTPNGLAAFRPGAEGGSEAAVTPAQGSSGSQPAPGSSQPGASSSSGATPSSASDLGAATAPATISAMKLTNNAVAAFARARAKLSQLGFSFKLSAASRVRATLAVRVRVHGRLRWRTISALSFLASAGTQVRRLGGRASLTAGSYRLTLTPARGTAKSLQFRIA
jgi:hypothetical protein